MRLLLPIFALVAIIALRRPDWLRGLSSESRRAATGLAGSGSRFGSGPGRGIGAVPAKAAELGGPSATSSRGRSVEGRPGAVVEVPQDAAMARGADPHPLRSAAAANAGREPVDGTHGVRKPWARFEEACGQLVRHPFSGGDLSKLEEPASGNGEEHRAGGVANDAVFQSTLGGVESRRRTARDAVPDSDDVGSEAAEAVLSAAGDGVHYMQQDMVGVVEGVARTNLRLARELFRMSDPAALVELHQHFAREYTDALLQGGAMVTRAVCRTADEALRPLERQIERQRDEAAKQGEGRLQSAAE